MKLESSLPLLAVWPLALALLAVAASGNCDLHFPNPTPRAALAPVRLAAGHERAHPVSPACLWHVRGRCHCRACAAGLAGHLQLCAARDSGPQQRRPHLSARPLPAGGCALPAHGGCAPAAACAAAAAAAARCHAAVAGGAPFAPGWRRWRGRCARAPSVLPHARGEHGAQGLCAGQRPRAPGAAPVLQRRPVPVAPAGRLGGRRWRGPLRTLLPAQRRRRILSSLLCRPCPECALSLHCSQRQQQQQQQQRRRRPRPAAAASRAVPAPQAARAWARRAPGLHRHSA